MITGHIASSEIGPNLAEIEGLSERTIFPNLAWSGLPPSDYLSTVLLQVKLLLPRIRFIIYFDMPCVQLKALGIDDVLHFPFLSPPPLSTLVERNISCTKPLPRLNQIDFSSSMDVTLAAR